LSAFSHGAIIRCGGSGGGTAVLVVLALVAAAAIARPVVHAVTEILGILVIVVAVLAGLGVAGLVAFAAVRVARWRAGGTTRVSLPAPTAQPLPEPQRAIEQHVHFHGLSAEDVAAIIERGRPV
jgi:hypothetical protein